MILEHRTTKKTLWNTTTKLNLQNKTHVTHLMEPNQRIEQRRNLKKNYRFQLRKLTEEPSKSNNET